MHELSLAASLFELLDCECSRLGRHNLVEVEIEIGDFAGVEKETFSFCLENAKEAYGYPQLLFTFIDVESMATCIECGNLFHPRKRIMQCPECESSQVILTTGKEFKVKSLIFCD